MSAQRYLPGIAHERMAKGLCPECGAAPGQHGGDSRFWIPNGSVGFSCSLLEVGVADRIAQFEADQQPDEIHEEDALDQQRHDAIELQQEMEAEFEGPLTPSMVGWQMDRDRFLDEHGWDPDDGRG
jgi:hypothetical protein